MFGDLLFPMISLGVALTLQKLSSLQGQGAEIKTTKVSEIFSWND